jgi:hypothetical protein
VFYNILLKTTCLVCTLDILLSGLETRIEVTNTKGKTRRNNKRRTVGEEEKGKKFNP